MLRDTVYILNKNRISRILNLQGFSKDLTSNSQQSLTGFNGKISTGFGKKKSKYSLDNLDIDNNLYIIPSTPLQPGQPSNSMVGKSSESVVSVASQYLSVEGNLQSSYSSKSVVSQSESDSLKSPLYSSISTYKPPISDYKYNPVYLREKLAKV